MSLNPDSAASSLSAQVESFANARILCIGDIMLDRFVYGSVGRISPEAPIPVLTRNREDVMLGGAGNVVRNIVSLGAQVGFISVVGDDSAGRELIQLIGREPRITPYVLTAHGRISTQKTRYIAGNQQLLRSDDETTSPISAELQDQILQLTAEELPQHQALILSDYGKGLLTATLTQKLIGLANQQNIPVFVDPKQRDFSCYAGAFLVSPNLSELVRAAGKDDLADTAAITDAAQNLIQAHQLGHLLVTRGKDGMSLYDANGASHHIPAQAREVFDVSGAGDTAIATLGVAYASGSPLPEAAQLANLAAGIVVGKLGTATIHRTDLKTALYTQDSTRSQSKILPQDIAAAAISSWKAEGQRVGFTNGCFDLLHAGHLSLLQDAKTQCDRLVVAINADASVKRLKGDSRPLNNEIDRAMLLAAMDPVDLVVIFREDTPLEILTLLKPDLLMKGADYTLDQVVGRNLVESYGGQVSLIPLREGYSSTGLIKKAQAAI